MTLRDVLENWDDISHQKKRQALQQVINFIDYEDNEDTLLKTILIIASDAEEDDYFGTEGLKI